MEKPPVTESQKSHVPEKQSPQEIAEEAMQTMAERLSYLENEKKGDFDRTREAHQKAIAFCQDFLVRNEEHVGSEWYQRFYSIVVRYETLFTEKMIDYANDAILEPAWDPLKIDHMRELASEISDRYLPIFESYQNHKIVDNLKAIEKSIELKIKAS